MKLLARSIRSLSTSLPLLVAAGLVHAQSPALGGIEEVFVTAQKRSENLQETPIAISAYSGDELLKLGVKDILTLMSQTPSIYGAQYPLSNTILTLFMRGQGNNDPMQVTKDGSIGFYENGIYNPRPQSVMFDLADVERVEVLRGPQGTLYGRNTTGGAVNVVSKAPTGEFGVRQLLGFGDRGQYRSVTNIDLPAMGSLLAKVTVAAANDDGYVRNIGSGSDFNTSEHLGGRVALLWQPTDSLTFDYGYTYVDLHTTPSYFTSPGLEGAPLISGYNYHATKHTTYRPVALNESPTTVSDHTLTASWEVSPSITLKSLTGLRNHDMTNYQDTVEAYGLGLPVTDFLQSDQFSQELQFIGSWGDRIEYVGGLYYYEEDVDHLQVGKFIFPGSSTRYDRLVDAKSESKAAYVQVTWTPDVLEDRLAITLGQRYTEDNREATRDYVIGGYPLDVNTKSDKEFNRSTPSITLAYSFSDDISGYAKVSSGYRAGGASESSSDFTRAFGPETVDSYEIGLKAEWLDNRLRTNLAVFTTDYNDIQLDVSPDPNNVTITQTFNAGKAEINGIELDVVAAVTEDLIFTLGYALLDTEVKEVRVAGSSVTADDFVIPYAPENSLNLAADWTFAHFSAGNVSAHLNYSYKDEAYATSGAGKNIPGYHFYANSAYSMLDARLTLEYQTPKFDGPLRVSLWCSNLLDSDEPVWTSAIGSSNTGYFSSNHFHAEPRSYGVELQFAL